MKNFIKNLFTILFVLVIIWFMVSYFNVVSHNSSPEIYEYPAWNFFKVLHLFK